MTVTGAALAVAGAGAALRLAGGAGLVTGTGGAECAGPAQTRVGASQVRMSAMRGGDPGQVTWCAGRRRAGRHGGAGDEAAVGDLGLPPGPA